MLCGRCCNCSCAIVSPMMYGPDVVAGLLKKSVKELKLVDIQFASFFSTFPYCIKLCRALAKAVAADISKCIEKKEIAVLISKSKLFQQRMQGEIRQQPNGSNKHKIHQQQRRNRTSASPAGAARNAVRSISQSRHQSGTHSVSGAGRKSVKGINSSMREQQFRSSDRNASSAVRRTARSVLHRNRHRASTAEPSVRSSANARNEAASGSARTGGRRNNLGKPGDAVRAAGRSCVNSKPNSAGYAAPSPGRASSRNANNCVRCNKAVPARARITLKSTRDNGIVVSMEGWICRI